MDDLVKLAYALKDTANRVVECRASDTERKRVIEDCIDFMRERAAQCWPTDPDEDLL